MIKFLIKWKFYTLNSCVCVCMHTHIRSIMLLESVKLKVILYASDA